MDAATRSTKRQLSEQYVRATGDSGRFEATDREAFIRHLLERIEAHTEMVCRPLQLLPDNDWATFNRQRAARQGRGAVEAFGFILHDLRKRHGTMNVKEHLTRVGSEQAMAISRRIAAPATTANLRLAALRVVRDGESEMHSLNGMIFNNEESARIDVFLDQSPTEHLQIAVAVDNPTRKRAWASGVDIRVQFQSEFGQTLTRSSVSLFGMLPMIEAGRREWIAFSGVDLLQEVQSELADGDRIFAMRLLITRR